MSPERQNEMWEELKKSMDDTARYRPWDLNHTWGMAPYHSPLQMILQYAGPVLVDLEEA